MATTRPSILVNPGSTTAVATVLPNANNTAGDQQIVSVGDPDDGNLQLKVNSDQSINTARVKSATGTQTSVAASASDGTVLASNAARKGAAVFNDSTATLYLLLASGTSSTSNYSVQLGPNGYFEVPFDYTGVLKGIWSAATGNARVTEMT